MQLTPAFIDDPYPLYGMLLQGPRMMWTDLWDGAWLVSRYADVIEVLRHPGLSAQRADHFTATLTPEQLEQFRPYLEAFSQWLLFMDPPRHGEVRRPLNKGFVPSTLAGWQSLIDETAHRLLDAAIAKGEFDFVADVARPFPAHIITRMLGFEDSMVPQLLEWSDDVAALFGSPVFHTELAVKAQDGLMAIHSYARSLLPERRKDPGDDLLSLILELEAKGVIGEEEVLSNVSNMLFGGHETVRRALGNGLHALLTHRDQWDTLVADPAGMAKGACREILRYDSPVQVSMRTVIEPIELLGQKVEKGHRVATMIGAGNRDPQRFEDPNTFDISREQGPPLTFGFGPHACIGAAMGRMEIETLVKLVATKAPSLTLVDPNPPHIPNPVFRSFATLPVKV